jgi:2-polyprenyl-3-methyl-5-hydroxy-6-metoxy-1,4-benzoquinol methylase
VDEKIREPYFIDDTFYGNRSAAMAEFSRLRVEVALNMIWSEGKRAGRSLRVLDVGCGDGKFSKIISDTGNEVYGIDLRPDRAKSAKQKGIEVNVTDATRGLPFRDGFFDLVYAAEVLEHIYDTEFFLQEARRALNKDGAIVVTVPNIASLPNRLRAIAGLYPKYVAPARRHWGVGEHIRAFTKSMLVELLGRNGFEVEEVKANVVSAIPTKRTRKPWSKTLGRTFPSLGEVLICKARKK